MFLVLLVLVLGETNYLSRLYFSLSTFLVNLFSTLLIATLLSLWPPPFAALLFDRPRFGRFVHCPWVVFAGTRSTPPPPWLAFHAEGCLHFSTVLALFPSPRFVRFAHCQWVVFAGTSGTPPDPWHAFHAVGW